MIKIFPFDIYETIEAESCLQDMAAKGYILTGLGFFAHYKKENPKKITYHIEPKMKNEYEPDRNKLDRYLQDAGTI